MKAFFVALAFALLDLNAPAAPAVNPQTYVVPLPYVHLFVSDAGTEDPADDFVYDFDVLDFVVE